LEYDVTLQINPARYFCFFENLPKVRAILSWNSPPPPNDPTFTPVWGNVVEERIQIAPGFFFELYKVFEEAKVKLPDKLSQLLDLKTLIPVSQPKTLGAAELQKLYAGKDVPEHRFLFTELQKAQFASSAETVKLSGFKGVPAKLTNIDLASVIEAWLNTDGDTSFEELDCLGLNPNTDTLVGTLTIKRPNGYSGGLCTAGSQEYVAFWVDWGSGWSYAGTTSVSVHDISGVPPEGLKYSVFLPVDVTSHRQPCEAGPKTARVRAILSWQSAPPWWDPDFIPTWGNREETLVQITPTPFVGTLPCLSSVGDILESKVDVNGMITDAVAIHTGAHFVNAPFGGRITIAGHIPNAVAGMKYRVMKKPHGTPDSEYIPISNEPAGLTLAINTFNGISWTQSNQTFHDLGNGYYSYEDYSSSHSVEGSIMGLWYSTLAEDSHAFDLRIDVSVDGNPANDLHSNVVTALVDNTPPTALLDIDLGAGVDCADFAPGTTFTGHYTATDTYFGAFSFVIRPAGPAHGVLPVPPSGASVFLGGSIFDPGVSGGTYSVNTGASPGPPPVGPMQECGYALTLQVTDRTNVNSGQTNNYNEASVGFCLRQLTERHWRGISMEVPVSQDRCSCISLSSLAKSPGGRG